MENNNNCDVVNVKLVRENREFLNDDGKVVEYTAVYIPFEVDGELVEIKLPTTDKFTKLCVALLFKGAK